MKRRSICLLLLGFFLIALTACDKEGPEGITGPQGDPGAKGEQGEPGQGISNVRKFNFTVEKGDAFANNSFPDRAWWGRTRGLLNNGAAYTIKSEDIGGMSVNDPNYLVLVYVRPEGGAFTTPQDKKILPATYNVNLATVNNVNNPQRRTEELWVELLTNVDEILVSRANPTNTSGRTNPFFFDMPQELHVEVHFIEIANKT